MFIRVTSCTGKVMRINVDEIKSYGEPYGETINDENTKSVLFFKGITPQAVRLLNTPEEIDKRLTDGGMIIA